MTQADPRSEAIKRAFKEALAETLHEQRDLLHEVFAGVLEDLACIQRPFEKGARPSVCSATKSSMPWRAERKEERKALAGPLIDGHLSELFPHPRLEGLFAQADVLGCDFDELIFTDVFEGFLQGHLAYGREVEGVVGA
jgi:hypothetical protein